jgi:transposase
MAKRIDLNEAQRVEIETARNENKNKNIEKRLKAVALYAQGFSRKQIALQTGYASTYIKKLVRKYCDNGLDALVGNHYRGNRRNFSVENEEALLKPFRETAAAGKIVEVSEIKAAYEAALGRRLTSRGQIYRVLERHGWRKVMPRSTHPNKASEEEIEASKKLTQR